MPQQEPRRAGDARSGPPALGLFVQLTLLFSLLTVLYLLELDYVRVPMLRAYLWSYGPDRFGDFWHYRALLEKLHRPEFFAASDRFAYPAPCAVLYRGLYHLGQRPHLSFNLLLWTIEGISALLFFRQLHRRGLQLGKAAGLVGLLVLTSYPWHFLYDRGNIEVFVYLFVAGGVWAWLTKHEALAAVLWGVAGSMKLFPLVLLAVFLTRLRWKLFLLGLLTCCGVLLLSFWYVGPTIPAAAAGTLSGILGFAGNYGAHARSAELVFDHSVLGAVKEIFELPRLAGPDHIPMISRVYEMLVAVAGPVAFLYWRRSAPALNQLCLLLLAAVLLPPVSYDYTLIHVYLVIGIVCCCALDAARHGEKFQGETAYMVAFAVLCTAQNWVSFSQLHPNGLLKCVALLTVALNIVRYPLRLRPRNIAATVPAEPALTTKAALRA